MMQRRSVRALALGIAILALSFVGGSGFALAQDKQAATQQQLDRIERKLDRIIEHLGIAGEHGTSTKDHEIPPSAGNPTKVDNTSPRPDTETEPGYQRGAVAIARVGPTKKNDLSEIPADSIGSFVYIGGTIPLSDLSRRVDSG